MHRNELTNKHKAFVEDLANTGFHERLMILKILIESILVYSLRENLHLCPFDFSKDFLSTIPETVEKITKEKQ